MGDDANFNGCDNSAGGRRSAPEIQDWMVAYIAKLMDVSSDQVDVSVPFEHFALESADAIGMTGDLEEWVGTRIDPMVVYDYPTIELLAKYLAEESSAG